MDTQATQSTEEGQDKQARTKKNQNAKQTDGALAASAFPDPDVHPAPENPIHQDEPLPPNIVGGAATTC